MYPALEPISKKESEQIDKHDGDFKDHISNPA